VFLFVIYAVAVWYLAIRHRRTWRGFVSVAAGVAFLVALAYLHAYFWGYLGGLLRGFQVLLYPYTVLVGLVGLYVASLPRNRNPHACQGCGYDRAGLTTGNPACPECGLVEYPLNGIACANCGLDLSRFSKKKGRCPKCAVAFRPADPPPPPGPDPRRRRAVYPRRIRHASPQASARTGRPPMTDQRQSES
jgi:hypothetical protein